VLPTEDELDIYHSQDERIATEHFLNKTLEQAEKMFRGNGLYYQEDLMWMGPKAFHFYLQAVINYLMSDASANDADFVSALNAVIRFRMQEEGFLSAVDNVRKLVDYVIDHFDKYGVNSDIYGDLLGEYRQLKSEL
jgi:hypothetical protein